MESFQSLTTPISPEAPPYSPITPHDTSVAGTSVSKVDETSLLLSVNTFQASTDALSSPLVTTTSPAAFPPPACASTISLPVTSSPIGSTENKWCGFKIVMDNIDMNIQPRHQTFERRPQSVHYVNTYAVKDRIDFSAHGCTTVSSNSNTLSIDSVLPSASDRDAIMTNFVVLAGRILCKAFPALQKIPHLMTEHIRHCYYKEMSCKSQIVGALVL